MDTYSQALSNYHSGKGPDTFTIIRDDDFTSTVPVGMFFDTKSFSNIETMALSSCLGKTLDIGAGVGRHSTELQRTGVDVTGIDISKTAVEIMNERGIHKTICCDIFHFSGPEFHTLLMLMNGIGIAGNPQKLDQLLTACHDLLTIDGEIFVESIDVLKSNDTTHKNYRDRNVSNSNYSGQQNLRIDYDGVLGSWFEWLHLTFVELTRHAEANQFEAELMIDEDDGRYLARLRKRS
jgi:SAM-dependent methyltransferase